MMKGGKRKAKLWGLEYVEGFHGAIAERISVHSLALSRKAEQAVEGDRSFRFLRRLPGWAACGAMQRRAPRRPLAQLRLQHHRPGGRLEPPSPGRAPRAVQRRTRGIHRSARHRHAAPWASCRLRMGRSWALPLLNPRGGGEKSALLLLSMGQAIRVSLLFRYCWWELGSRSAAMGAGRARRHELRLLAPGMVPHLVDAGNLGSHPHRMGGLAPRRTPQRTPRWLIHSGQGSPIAFRHLRRCASHAGSYRSRACYVHDWQSDPYARGSYSYVAVDGEKGATELRFFL